MFLSICAGLYVFDWAVYSVSSACRGYHLPHVPVHSEAADGGPSRVGLSGVQGMNILVKLGPYDFHDVENTGIVEFSHENRI